MGIKLIVMTKKRTTLFLDQGEFLGGAERFLIDFLKSTNDLEKKLMNPILVGAKNPKYRNLVADIPHEDFSFPSVKGGLIKKGVASSKLILAAYKLKQLSKKKNANVFFTNTPRTHFVMFLAKKIFHISGKWICMFHDFTVPNFLVRNISRHADVLIANGVPLRNFLRERINSKNYEKIRIVENGIDFTSIPTARSVSQIKNILIIGRIDPRKGQMHVLEVADKAQTTYPNLKFTIVGNSVKEDLSTIAYEKKLHRFVKFRRLKNINFISEVNDPFTEINKSDLVLFLPTEPETFGRVVTESLSQGKLVIAFDETGPREILKSYEQFLDNPKTSLLVESLNTKALTEKIEFFINTSEQLQFFTNRAREFVEKKFSLTETKKLLLTILME